MKELFEQVKQWLSSLTNPAFDFEGFELTVLGESKALAVKYSQALDGYTSTSYYVVAPLPKKYRRGNVNKNGSEFFGGGKHFYIAAYYPEGYAKESLKQYHPFGANYILREIDDLAKHRIAYQTPHTIPLQMLPL